MRRSRASKADGPPLAVAGDVPGLGPQRPVVRAHVEGVQHGVLDDVHPGRVHAVAGGVRPVVAMVAVLHHHREPGRPVRQLLDLLGLVEDHAVGAQPAAAADRAVEHRAVPGAADVGLRVHDERDAAPGARSAARSCPRTCARPGRGPGSGSGSRSCAPRPRSRTSSGRRTRRAGRRRARPRAAR